MLIEWRLTTESKHFDGTGAIAESQGNRCESCAVPLLYEASRPQQSHWETGKAGARDDLRARIPACSMLLRLRAMAEGQRRSVFDVCSFMLWMAPETELFFCVCSDSMAPQGAIFLCGGFADFMSGKERCLRKDVQALPNFEIVFNADEDRSMKK